MAIKTFFKLLVLIYQWTIGLVLPPRCRFYPSCSEYAREALNVHPVHYALWLILKRLLKCQPLCQGGIDLVPPKRGININEGNDQSQAY